ncbi:MAG: SDR family NAD(P)-dependent oxidoreductase [Chloroflexi bacterium]|nr:SDR family NAD(P)-dependent oxidoreductase [Chloroflexota bacterium]
MNLFRVPLENKVVLITGASSGFGEDAAWLFAEEGCKVVLAARRIDRLRRLASKIQDAGGEAIAVPVDIVNPDDVDNMVKTTIDLYDRIDILFNNAGIGRVGWFEEHSVERDIDLLIRVNLIGMMQVTRMGPPAHDRPPRGTHHQHDFRRGLDLPAAHCQLFRQQVWRARFHRFAPPRSRALRHQGQRHLPRSRLHRVWKPRREKHRLSIRPFILQRAPFVRLRRSSRARRRQTSAPQPGHSLVVSRRHHLRHALPRRGGLDHHALFAYQT